MSIPQDQSIPALDTVTGVMTELFNAEEDIKAQFSAAVSSQLIEFAEVFAPTYAAFQNFAKASGGNQHRALTAGLLHGVIDDLLMSIKVMVMGNLTASGNLARQASEGLCMALLCGQDGTVLVKKKKTLKEITYWKFLLANNPLVEGNKACAQVLINHERLGLTQAIAQDIKNVISTHHSHSHAGVMAMVNRMDLGGTNRIYYGGHFDSEKVEAYRLEVLQRTKVCRWTQEAMQKLWPQAAPI